jgi:hypothetical protein
MNIQRALALTTAVAVSAIWGVLALTNYPIIVIADSDLGVGAMLRFRDAGTLFLLSLAAAALTAGLVPWPRLRLCLLAAVGGLLAGCPFESADTTHGARWPLLAVVGLGMAAEYATARRLRDRPPAPLREVALAFLVPALLVLTDYHGRAYFGQLPATAVGVGASGQGWRTSVSLLDWEAGGKALSREGRLRAVGRKDGTLTVHNLDGGPALRLPPRAEDRMLDVLTFSPDGKALAVADNDRMCVGSVITVWDVAPGDTRTHPAIGQRRPNGASLGRHGGGGVATVGHSRGRRGAAPDGRHSAVFLGMFWAGGARPRRTGGNGRALPANHERPVR